MKKKLSAKNLADEFELTLIGEDQFITGFSIPENQKESTLLWTKTIDVLRKVKTGILISPEEFSTQNLEKKVTYLFCKKSPRLIFAKIINKYFTNLITDDLTNYVDHHKKNLSIRIGDNCFIAKNVTIGSGTTILHNCSIFENSIIGQNCLIQPNCSIATPGLGYEFDGDEMVKFPQLGGVVIEDLVEIGPGSTIRKGALGNTIIGKESKIGALSNIGHNSKIGAQSILTCQCIIGGSAILGSRTYMGMNAIVKNKVIVGDNVTIGIGSVVVKNVPDNATVIGIPAKIV